MDRGTGNWVRIPNGHAAVLWGIIVHLCHCCKVGRRAIVTILESEDLPTASGLHIVTNDDYRVQKEKGFVSLFFL